MLFGCLRLSILNSLRLKLAFWLKYLIVLPHLEGRWRDSRWRQTADDGDSRWRPNLGDVGEPRATFRPDSEGCDNGAGELGEPLQKVGCPRFQYRSLHGVHDW